MFNSSTATHGIHSNGTARSIPARAFEDLLLNYQGKIGRHPEVIEEAVRSANEAKLESGRSMKANLADFEKRHRELSQELKNWVEVVQPKRAKAIKETFLAEADWLADECRDAGLAMTKLQMEINYRESVVADKKQISEAAVKFEAVVKSLSPEDQKKLGHLIVREVSVKQFDPETDHAPKEKGIFPTQIRTRWYSVNISLFANDLISGIYENGKTSSDSKTIGSRGRTRPVHINKIADFIGVSSVIRRNPS